MGAPSVELTIADKLLLLKDEIDNARDAIIAMGGTVTSDGGSSQLAEDIETIPIGGSGGSYITVSQTEPTSADGSDGDFWMVLEE